MNRKLDIENWARKDHFNFFKEFDEPFWGVTVDLDCTGTYLKCKEKGYSFFLYYLHLSLKAANSLEPFRYRIVGDDVIVFDQVNASPTINRPDGTFGFAYMEFKERFNEFEKLAQTEITRIQSSKGLVPAISGENVIHYSSIPWVKFTSLSHARSFSFPDSCPKISFGKMVEDQDKRKIMPVSIHGHHGLMDGYHVGQYIESFQDLLNGA